MRTGTVHGRYSETLKFTNGNDATAKGTQTWSGGTGAYKGAAGKDSGTCSTTNGFASETCQSVGDVTGL